MGRPKGSKNKQISDEAQEIEASGENVVELKPASAPKATVQELSDAQREQLFHHHSKSYGKALAAKKKSDADFKNVCKLARSEMGADAVFRIKLGAMLETQEGEDEKKAELAATIEVAAWVGSEIGTQLRMFDAADGVPLGMRAYESGRRAGLAGEKRKSPHAPGSEEDQQYLSGWSDGQTELAQTGFKPFPDSDASRSPSYEVIN